MAHRLVPPKPTRRSRLGLGNGLTSRSAGTSASEREAGRVTRPASSQSGGETPQVTRGREQGREWRCVCGKLLGRYHGTELHVRIHRGPEIYAGLPARAICPRCGYTNRATLPLEASPSDSD